MIRPDGDFIGYIRVEVNQQNPLSSAVSCRLDQFEIRDEKGNLIDPPGTIARLYLVGAHFQLVNDAKRWSGIPVAECLPGQEWSPTTSG